MIRYLIFIGACWVFYHSTVKPLYKDIKTKLKGEGK